MRWFVEVSRVGENSSGEKYCVEAKQWQAALQEARKLRGDSGPLSKFSIELLDDGYRAVDPKQKLRYVVAKAPQDAELSVAAPESAFRPEAAHLNGQTATPSVAPAAPVVVPAPVVAPAPAPVVAPAPAPVVASAPAPVVASAPAPPLGPAPAYFAHAEPYAGVPSSALSPAAPGSAVRALGAESASKSPSAFPPRPTSAKTAAGIMVPADVIPPAPAVPSGLGLATSAVAQNLTQPSAALEMPPPSSILRKRQEEPTPQSPITYREVAYVVEPGVSRGSVEALLWASFNSLARELASRPGQKFVQLAVFDHKFDKRPERAPLGTLAWKDWRGNPVITFPLFDGTAAARASAPPPATGSIKPVAVVQVSGSSGPPPAPAAAAPAAVVASATSTPVIPLVIASGGPGSIPPAPAVIASAQPLGPDPLAAPAAAAPATAAPAAAAPAAAAPAAAAPAAAAPATAAPATAAPATAAPATAAPATAAPVATEPAVEPAKSDPNGAAIPLTREKLPSHPSSARSSKPRLAAVRRRAGEDLIGELFETMHDLSFMHGVAEGAEFVLAAVESVMPCDGAMIHVFDINTRQFVVVRAKGPGTMQAILHRTPDTDEFFANIMRRPGSVAVHDTAKDPRVLGPRWDALGVKPVRALCGPVRQGGRYLGLIEVANPLGDAPFHQTEQNALDYVCEQFAQFLTNRPIVLDADVILRR